MLLRNKRQFFFVIAFLLYLCTTALSADTPPSEEDVNKFAQQAKQTYDDFLNHTFEIRMRYEYFGLFQDPCEKDQLRQMALAVVNDLDGIANNQLNLKQLIENYPKDDWEIRFGQTGLWRRSAAELLKTTLNRLEVQYYLAIAFDQRGQTDILHQILTQLDTLGNLSNSPDWHLLKAKTLALLSTTDPAYKSLAKKELDTVLAQQNIPCIARYKAELKMIKLLGPKTPGNLGELADQIAQTDCKSDGEITLTLACLGHRFEPESLEKTVSLFSLIQNQFGRIVLDDLQQRYKEDGLADVNALPVTAYEAEQAAGVASGMKLETYGPIFERLVYAPKFMTPALLFTAGRAVIGTSPTKTTRLWIDASRLMKGKSYGMSAEMVAKLAIGSLSKLSTENTTDCPLIIEAYDNYLSIADSNSDADFNHIEYFYASVLDSCGKENQSKQLLEKIAAKSGSYQNHAKFVFITRQLQQAQTKAEKNVLAARLAELISNIPSKGSENHDLRYDATALYCQTLLEDANSQSAQKVLDILDGNDYESKFNLFKAKAFQQLGQLEKSAYFMSQVLDANDGSMAPQAVSLLSEILDRIELWQQDANDFNQMLQNCVALAEFADKSYKSEQAAVVFAEISILDGKKISFTNENEIRWLRPKARLLMAQGDFNQASLLWSKIAELRRNDPVASGQKSYNWWQAKFYELDCLAKSKADNQNITHTIDVLFNTFPDIPSPWAEKLNTLKEQCVSGPPAN